uniref:Chloroplast fucoxanthin chlorophyll A/C protein n=1 Tax=Polykrikos lebourae TaxID=370573 RepID=A0A0K0TN08_9DINO|nr:chloroplast fucoxanthin chlorophyll A/C protein [Polykrikos lebourae]
MMSCPGSMKLAAAGAALWAFQRSTAFVPGTQHSIIPQVGGLRGTGQMASDSFAPGSAAFAAGVVGAGALAATCLRPRAEKRRQATRVQAFDQEIGTTMPFKYFDPLGLGKNDDEADFRRRRCAEIKNGRVAMLACMGYIAPEFSRFPGYCSPSYALKFTDIPNGIAALYKLPFEGWIQIGVFIGFLELFPFWQFADRAPGDFKGAGRLGIPMFFLANAEGPVCDPVKNRRSLDAELNNGRLAMMAITGMIAQNSLFGTTDAKMWLP